MKRLFLFAILFPAVVFADIETVRSCLKKRYEKFDQHRAISVAVVSAEQTRRLVFGRAKIGQIYEIGSITKTFTGHLLAQEVLAGTVSIDDQIPAEYQKGRTPITYRHLATHTSGIISGVFPDFVPRNPESPYEGLDPITFKNQYDKTRLVSVPGERFAYSNIATGLLGLIFAEKNNRAYEDLVHERIFEPLGMKNTYFTVPASQTRLFPPGNVNGEPFSPWNLDGSVISAAAGIRSTISDMAIYARANLAPQLSPLKDTHILAQQRLYTIQPKVSGVGMFWMHNVKSGMVWHNGSTIAFNSILAISHLKQIAVVALTDTGIFNQGENGQYKFDTSFQDVVFECLK